VTSRSGTLGPVIVVGENHPSAVAAASPRGVGALRLE